MYVQWLMVPQMPLKELIIFHHDQEYLDDVQSLESYVSAELNVVNITYSSDEAAIGIKYRAAADWPTLGKKLRKDIGKVKSALPNMTSEQCKDFVKMGNIDINGVELVVGDLVVSRYVESADGGSHDSATDLDVIILLDVRKHADLESMALLRALTSRVNKLRKEAGLKATDKVDILYEYDDGQEDVLGSAVREHEEFLVKQIGGAPVLMSQVGAGKKMTAVEKRAKDAEDLTSEERFVLSLAVRQ
jgi:isoleucyl-tRNA synthetase